MEGMIEMTNADVAGSPSQGLGEGGISVQPYNRLTPPSPAHPSGELMFTRTISCRNLVKQVMISYPSTRGDDRLLTYRVWRACGLRLTTRQYGVLFELLRRSWSPETITRRRREIQAEDATLQPTERTQQKRARRMWAFKRNFAPEMKLYEF